MVVLRMSASTLGHGIRMRELTARLPSTMRRLLKFYLGVLATRACYLAYTEVASFLNPLLLSLRLVHARLAGGTSARVTVESLGHARAAAACHVAVHPALPSAQP